MDYGSSDGHVTHQELSCQVRYMKTKYYQGIRDAQRDQVPVDQLPAFDAEKMRSSGFISKIVGRVLDNPRWIFTLLRRFKPNVKLGPFVFISKNVDVREVLERQNVFETPFGPEMEEMAGGSNFILGMSDSKDYRKMKSAVLSAFPVDEVEERIRPIAAKHSRGIMLRAESGIDVVDKLLKIVPVKVCREYYGLLISDEVGFADRALALSALFFGDPGGSATTRDLARVAARDMTDVIDRSVQAVRSGSIGADTPLARLVAMVDREEDPITIEDLRSIMMGMVTGFMPTNLLAAGNCLEIILKNRDAQNAVEEAIAADDNKLLEKSIVEAMRFKPINMGPFRYAREDCTIAEGTSRAYKVKAGTSVWPLTWSAMFDPDAVTDPNSFDPLRPDTSYMVFGHGIHWCIGAALAKVQIAEAFKAIFSKQNVRRAAGSAGKLKKRGPYPEGLSIEFDLPSNCRMVEHAMLTMCFPVKNGSDIVALREKISAFGNPVRGPLCENLDECGTVHFSSITVVGESETSGPSDAHPAQIVLEMSADGNQASALRAFAAATEEYLRPVFEEFSGLEPKISFETFLNENNVTFGPMPWHHSGLPFSGNPGHSVERIKNEADLQLAISMKLSERDAQWPRHAMGILDEIRRQLANEGGFEWAFVPAESILENEPGSWGKAIRQILFKTAGGASLLVFWAIASFLTYHYVLEGADSWMGMAFSAFSAILLGFIGLAAIIGAISGLLIFILRRLEARDSFSVEQVGLERYEAIVSRENQSQQNHLTGISVLKGGWFRRAALRLTFYVIGVAARFVFKPGTLSDIDTIHFARWAVIPNTNKLLFFSNYGGSWESYLEDFITKARQGLTGVWSNTIGYPPTKWLFQEGAKNGDLFKRWARMQQAPTLFWYQAYPGINTRRVRINSAIRHGLARARTEDEAQKWLNLFGSLPRPDYILETNEIQSIVFGAMGKHVAAEMIGVEIPKSINNAKRKAWLSWLEQNLAFGDRKPGETAMIAVFGPNGLANLGLEEHAASGTLDGFPASFRQGMFHASRARILDDDGKNAAEKWDWGNETNPVDAVILCYASGNRPRDKTPGDRKKNDGIELRSANRKLASLTGEVVRHCKKAGIIISTRIPLEVDKMDNGFSREHFGFADGISQPLIKGTSKALGNVPQQNVVEAGEFILGYRDQRRNYPLSPGVPDFADHESLLAALPSQDNRDGGAKHIDGLRDFGRNGTFFVIRQLEQHVDDFHDFCAAAAKKVNNSGKLDRPVTRDWIGAKMVGRWQDGSSLVRNQFGDKKISPDNDFTFGAEDPQGMRCPLGSHVRRANPRDSLGEDRERQTELAKRHRILRVGRRYTKKAAKGKKEEKGLLFMCLNADIERQFEFIQQTWVSASAFHGLKTERDPLIGDPQKNDKFTIPTERGGVTLDGLRGFTTMRGGGYYFMPSRSALKFLQSQL